MNLKELINQFREDADDVAQPFLWGDPKLTRYANQAVEEAARRARILRDATTASVCRYKVEAEKPFIRLHVSVIEIKHAQLRITDPDDDTITRVHELRRAHSSDLELEDRGWRECSGEPRRYVTDIESGSIRFDSVPTCDAVLELEVVRMPLRKMERPEDCPEIPARYHADLVNWMLFRAYSKRDTDTENREGASIAEGNFTRVFGEPSSAIDESWRANKADFRKPRTRFF